MLKLSAILCVLSEGKKCLMLCLKFERVSVMLNFYYYHCAED